MSTNILNSEDFGLKIYNRFPTKYREDDVGQNFALKRYMEALSDGGFKYSIDEINGITHLIDPDKVDAKVLPVLFKQYGLEVFNGIPESYLRYLLPKLGEAWAKKGSVSVIEFITSTLSGIKTSTEINYDDHNNPIIDVKLEMDYNIGDYFPETEQFNRILQNFLPFYCDMNLLYSYLFYEDTNLSLKEKEVLFNIKNTYDKNVGFSLVKKDLSKEKSAVLGEAIMGSSILGGFEYSDTYSEHITDTKMESANIKQPMDSFLNKEYNTLNDIYCYDKITVNGVTEIRIN